MCGIIATGALCAAAGVWLGLVLEIRLHRRRRTAEAAAHGRRAAAAVTRDRVMNRAARRDVMTKVKQDTPERTPTSCSTTSTGAPGRTPTSSPDPGPERDPK